MDFIDLKTQQKRIKETLDANVQKVLAHGNYIMGPEVKELEAKLAAFVGVKHAIGCASGTDALLMALLAYGVGPAAPHSAGEPERVGAIFGPYQV